MPKTKPDDRQRDLAKHAGKRSTVKFNEKIMHPNMDPFQKGEVVEFEDPAAAAYFDLAFNGTELTDEEPTRKVTKEELNFDPEAEGGTIYLDTRIVGRQGLPDGTTVHQAATGEHGPGAAALDVKDVEVASEG